MRARGITGTTHFSVDFHEVAVDLLGARVLYSGVQISGLCDGTLEEEANPVNREMRSIVMRNWPSGLREINLHVVLRLPH
jgi:hypothetical protein